MPQTGSVGVSHSYGYTSRQISMSGLKRYLKRLNVLVFGRRECKKARIH